MNILIIEDEKHAANRLIKLLKTIDSDFNILDILESINLSVKWLQNNPQPELIFLDIQLSDGLSFNIFKQVDVTCPVIFTTAYDEFALQAFELNSIDYLLKPINTNKLAKSIDKFKRLSNMQTVSKFNFDSQALIEALTKKEATFKTNFLVNKGSQLVIINIEDIAYFFAEDKLVFLVTHDKQKFNINDSLDTIEKEIGNKSFYRVNRQYLVSVKSIKEIHNHFNYKLKLSLNPLPKDENIVITKSKVIAFKNWLSTR